MSPAAPAGSLRLVRAARVLLPDGRVLPDGALLLHLGSGRIVDVGDARLLVPRHSDVACEDWGDVLVMPGLVNGHAHTFQSLLRGLGDDLNFDRWRDQVLYPSARWLTAEDIESGALLAAADMLLAGITTVAEFFYLNDQGNANAQVAIDALRRIGIRTVFGRAMYDGSAAPARYRERPLDAYDRVLALANRYLDDPLVRVVPAPHSLHAASPEVIRLGAEAAGRLQSVFTIHVAERKDEVQAIVPHAARGAAAYLDGLGALSPAAVLVHGVWLDEKDLRLVAQRGARIVHNPGANAFLGDGVAPLPLIRALGIPVALGTDGGCTNNRLSILDEMRAAIVLQRAVHADGGLFTAADALAMGTSEGAAVLGLAGAGRIEPGALADLCVLDLDDPALVPEHDLVSSVVYSAAARAVCRVTVHGVDRVVDGRLVALDRRELRERAAASMARSRRASESAI